MSLINTQIRGPSLSIIQELHLNFSYVMAFTEVFGLLSPSQFRAADLRRAQSRGVVLGKRLPASCPLL